MTDSAADLSIQNAHNLDISVIRLPIQIDDETFFEEIGISRDQLIEKMRNGAKCKTAQPILGDLLNFWTEQLKTSEKILYLPLSSKLSGSYQSAFTLAQEFDGRVIVVDTELVAYPLQYACVQAKKLADDGRSLEEIKEIIENDTFMYAALIPENLETLKRGGRISAAAAALGNLMKITPILKVENGAIDVLDKVRTQKKAIQVALDEITKIENPENYHWCVVEADAQQLAYEVAETLKMMIQQEVVIHPLYPVIMAHTGPGTIGIGYIKKIHEA